MMREHFDYFSQAWRRDYCISLSFLEFSYRYQQFLYRKLCRYCRRSMQESQHQRYTSPLQARWPALPLSEKPRYILMQLISLIQLFHSARQARVISAFSSRHYASRTGITHIDTPPSFHIAAADFDDNDVSFRFSGHIHISRLRRFDIDYYRWRRISMHYSDIAAISRAIE